MVAEELGHMISADYVDLLEPVRKKKSDGGDGSVRYANPRAGELLGLERDELIGRDFEFSESSDTGREIQVQRPDGSESWLEVQRGAGRRAVERVYDDTLAGRTEPQHGHVLSLWTAAS